MYDFQLILKKDNQKFNEILKLLTTNKAYSISGDKINNEYIITDIEMLETFELDTSICFIKMNNQKNIEIRINEDCSHNIILYRENLAYCGIYNVLKLNVPCCLITVKHHTAWSLIGIAEPKIKCDEVNIKGLINIEIEFNHLEDYQEIIGYKDELNSRCVFQKGTFEFKIGHTYRIKYQKIVTCGLSKIIESVEV